MSQKTNILTYDISWRSKKVYSSSKDKYIVQYRKYLKTKKPDYVAEALEIYRNPVYKMFLESMLLSSCSDDECTEFFGCETRVITFYKKVFFDIDPVMGSKAKKIAIAKEARPNEQNLKMCAVKFGKEFIRWFVGVDKELDDEYIDLLKKRLNDGLLLKSLGHEFEGSMSGNMGTYLKMIGMVKQSLNERQSEGGLGVKDVIDHFAKFFENN